MFRGEGPIAVQSSMVLDAIARFDMISWSTVVVHDITAINEMRVNWGPVLKVSSRVTQLIIGLVHWSQGSPRKLRADG